MPVLPPPERESIRQAVSASWPDIRALYVYWLLWQRSLCMPCCMHVRLHLVYGGANLLAAYVMQRNGIAAACLLDPSHSYVYTCVHV